MHVSTVYEDPPGSHTTKPQEPLVKWCPLLYISLLIHSLSLWWITVTFVVKLQQAPSDSTLSLYSLIAGFN